MNKGVSLLKAYEVSLTRDICLTFFAESQIKGAPDWQYFSQRIAEMIGLDIGVMFAYLKDNEVVGIICALIYPDLFTGDKVCMETFWYVYPEYRQSPIGIKLLCALENYAAEKDCKRFYVGNLKAVNDEKMHRLYERLHFKEVETHYLKVLCP